MRYTPYTPYTCPLYQIIIAISDNTSDSQLESSRWYICDALCHHIAYHDDNATLSTHTALNHWLSWPLHSVKGVIRIFCLHSHHFVIHYKWMTSQCRLWSSFRNLYVLSPFSVSPALSTYEQKRICALQSSSCPFYAVWSAEVVIDMPVLLSILPSIFLSMFVFSFRFLLRQCKRCFQIPNIDRKGLVQCPVGGRDGKGIGSMAHMTGSGQEIVLTNNSVRDYWVCYDCVCRDHKGSQWDSIPSNKITITAASVHHITFACCLIILPQCSARLFLYS